MMIEVRAMPGRRWIRPARPKPSISGMLASSSDQRGRLGPAASSLGQGLPGPPRPSGPRPARPQLVSISSRMRRLVALSSTTSTRQAVRVAASDGAAPGGSDRATGPARGEVERAALARLRSRPRSGRPSCATSCGGDGQAQPGAAVAAAWSSRRPGRRPRRSCRSLSGGMPMPVSRDGEVQHDLLVRRDSPADRDDDLALLGELDGVADQVDERSGAGGPGRRPARRARPAATWQASSRPLLWARRASGSQRVAHGVAQVERGWAPAPACRPRSWRSRGCR